MYLRLQRRRGREPGRQGPASAREGRQAPRNARNAIEDAAADEFSSLRQLHVPSNERPAKRRASSSMQRMCKFVLCRGLA